MTIFLPTSIPTRDPGWSTCISAKWHCLRIQGEGTEVCTKRNRNWGGK